MFARRRPLLRAAAVGGAAYVAGKKGAQHQAETQQAQPAPQAQQQQPAPEARPPAGGQQGGPGGSMTEQLHRLASLHQQGALTDTEFAAAKAKLLGT